MNLTSGTTADAIVERLAGWGVDTIFGLPGDAMNGFVEAMRRRKVRFVHVRHEEIGALAAVGYAKFTGRLGVCFATAAPGAVHLLNAMLDARMDQVPLLAITGMPDHDLLGTETLQGISSDYLFHPFSLFNERVMGGAHVPNVVDRACRVALAQRGPVHLAIPSDFQSRPADQDSPGPNNVPGHTRPGYEAVVRVPERSQLEAAAHALAGRRKPLILAGSGARGAAAELEALAEALGAPITKAMLGKDVLPDASPYAIGGTGHTATGPTTLALQECDALVVVGSTMPFLKWYPKPGQAVCVQIDDRPERIGLRVPVDVGLAGDARATVRELLPLLRRNDDRSFLETAQRRMAAWWALMEERGTSEAAPLRPQVVAWSLSELLRDDAVVCADAGTVAYWANRLLRVRGTQRFSLSGTICTMTSGLAYAIGAQVAHPTRQVVAFMGDGAMAMALGDLATLAQHRLPVKVVVLRNESLSLENWEQLLFLGNPEFGNELSPIDLVKVAEACGLSAVRIDDARRCREQMREALAAEGPALIECAVDPWEPPLEVPPSKEHAEHFLEALKKGTTHGEAMATGALCALEELERHLPEAIDADTRRFIERLRARK
jgi:pyruvate dehydrogenase (quinone)